MTFLSSATVTFTDNSVGQSAVTPGIAWSRVRIQSKGLFTWSGGPRSSGVGFFCFHALGDTKQKKPTPLDRGTPLHVNRP